MFIELIDLLRCPRQHADSWLVAAFNSMDGRFVVEGKLGCPVCSASYSITDGIADLRLDVGAPNNEEQESSATAQTVSHDDDTAVRAAALLGLTNPNALVVLAGSAASLSSNIGEMTESRIMAINPVTRLGQSERVAVIRARERFPFASGSVDGIMMDASSAATFAHDAGRVLRQGGRLVGPATLRIDGQFRELARDDTNVVAESVGQLISLSR